MERYVICDIEATGLEEDREIIEIALITLVDDKVTDVYETLINPLKPLPKFIQQLTSISSRQLNEAPKFYDVADAIRMRLEGSIFVSHNTEFDLEILKRKYREMGQELRLKSFCTLKVAQEEIPGLKNYNLDALCSFFHIKIRDRHRAIGDARATLELFHELRNLKHKSYPKMMFLPHHERSLKQLTHQAGLLIFKNPQGQTVRIENCFDMAERGQELLKVTPENRELLIDTETVTGEPTGSALIAEFKKIILHPSHYHWCVGIQLLPNGEKRFKISPYRKGTKGLWYFSHYPKARKKLKELELSLKGETYIYRDVERSKEEILRHNQKLEALAREARFPAENLLILGEGRSLGEKSLVLVRDGHVLGYGFSTDSEEKIFQHPDLYLEKRFKNHVGADLACIRHLRILKNLRHKKEFWRSLSVRDRLKSVSGEIR